MDVRISGAEQFRDLAKQFRDLGKEGLGREMSKAIGKAVAPITRAIDEEAGEVAPSGYEDELTRSIRHRRTLRNTRTQASVRITTTAKGKKGNRDLPAINAGRLRHPVYGRFRMTKAGPKANPWSVTQIRAGFHTRGTAKASDEAEKQLWGVLEHYQQIITGG